jgi:hypothetical protein
MDTSMSALVYYHPSAKQFIVLQNKPNKPILYYLEHTHTCCSICELRHSLDLSQRKLRLGTKEARKTSQYDIKILAAHGCHTPSVCGETQQVHGFWYVRSTHTGNAKLRWENLNGRYHLRDFGVDGMLTLKLVNY